MSAEAIPAELRQTEQGWQLLRGGEPYFIRGASGNASLKQLAAAGANSVRTWDADNIDDLLDEVLTLGLSVTVGIWQGHERHGFDYGNEQQVAEQFERSRRIVLRYKDHPAVLLWGIGNEMEGTSTWFGMLLNDGSSLGAVDAMTEFWSGSQPSELAPTVEPLVIKGRPEVEPGSEIRARSVVADPEGSEIRVRWVLRPDSDDHTTGCDVRANLPDIDGAILDGDINGARARMLDIPSAYRLFLYAHDEGGNAATANMPLLVKGERRTRLPVSVYEDGFESMPWAPSGWMGAFDS